MTSKQLTQNQTSQAIAISAVDLIQQFKLSRQMPLVIAGYVEEIIEPSLDQFLKQTILNQLFDNWLTQQDQQLTKNIQVTS